MKYDLKGHIRGNKAFYIYLLSLNNYSVKPTLSLMLPQIVCAILSPIPKFFDQITYNLDLRSYGQLFPCFMHFPKTLLSLITAIYKSKVY